MDAILRIDLQPKMAVVELTESVLMVDPVDARDTFVRSTLSSAITLT